MTKPLLFGAALCCLALFSVTISGAQPAPLKQDKLVAALDQELSGESAKRNLEYITRLHRMRGSDDYNQATDFIQSKLKEYGLESIEVIKIPTDGVTMYGTQKSQMAWNAEFAELWELTEQNGTWAPTVKIADWASMPLVLAQDSETGEATADLIDIGAGTTENDYTGKDIRGKLVLTSSQPGAVVPLAIEKYGAAGIISYAQNQKTAWYGEDENLIRWGHLDSFAKTKTFGFMVSLKQARAFQKRLAAGETVKLHAKVVASQKPGAYNILTAVIDGSDPALKNEEIAFSCHLDHPRPGANDNASGCATILEVARTLKKLIDEGKIERPRRTMRFIWSPEIEGTVSLLNYKPELAEKIKFNVHMDMVGGGPVTKAIFHVSKDPMSLPHFSNDVGEAFGAFVNESSNAFASGEPASHPIVSLEGGKEPLQAVLGNFHMGSDHDVYYEGSFRIPSIYLHDWPDRYIHTNFDLPANIDPTKLKRSGFIGGASGYYLANLSASDLAPLTELLKIQSLGRSAQLLSYCSQLNAEEQENAKHYFWSAEMEVFNSLKPFISVNKATGTAYVEYLNNLKKTLGPGRKVGSTHASAQLVYTRNSDIKGPMSVFGSNYFNDHYDKNKPRPQLFNYTGIRGSEYTYEALNLVNGKNSVMEIRNILSAEFGPVPVALVAEYLEALQSINIVNLKK